jgi:hypothetical protein
MTVMHAFGALVVGCLQRMCRGVDKGDAGQDGGADTVRSGSETCKATSCCNRRRITNARAPRVCQTQPESSQKFSNAKTAVFRERCGE